MKPGRIGTLAARALAMATSAMVLVAAPAAAPAAAHELTPDQLRSVTFVQRLGQEVPRDLAFRDEDGQAVTLGSYLGTRPVILTLNDYRCQNLCPLELEGLMNGLNGITFTLGKDFEVVSVSIDPREGPDDATSTKLRGLRNYDHPQDGAGWHVLTGDQTSIDRLAQSVGFQYSYDPDANEFAHPLGVVVLTPQGQVSRYLTGLDYSATDLRLALVDATAARIGSLLDRALLVCYHYDPLTGRYTPLALDLLRGGGAAGVLAMALLLGWLWRTDLRRNASPRQGT